MFQKCAHPGCTTRANFGVAGSKKADSARSTPRTGWSTSWPRRVLTRAVPRSPPAALLAARRRHSAQNTNRTGWWTLLSPDPKSMYTCNTPLVGLPSLAFRGLMGGGFCRTYPRYLFAVAAQANTGRRPVEAGVLPPCREDICDSWPAPTSTPNAIRFLLRPMVKSFNVSPNYVVIYMKTNQRAE